MNNENLLKLAALLESRTHTRFYFGEYGRKNKLGVIEPSCPIGHYTHACLFPGMRLAPVEYADFAVLLDEKNKPHAFDSPRILQHFGITAAEAAELFDEDGCGGTRSPQSAADYIREFVRKRSANNPLAAELELLRTHAVTDSALRLSCTEAARATLLALADVTDFVELPKPELNNGYCSPAELRRLAELPEYSWQLLTEIANAVNQAKRDVKVFTRKAVEGHKAIAEALKGDK